MSSAQPAFSDRAARVAAPVLVSFSASSFAVRDFTIDLSEGGIFLATDRMCSIGTEGTLQFRVSTFDEPFVLRGRVVRVVEAVDPKSRHNGMGIQFIDPSEDDLLRLRRLVEGIGNGSVTESIRDSVRESGHSLDRELKRRSIDQKLMLAVSANAQEIIALIRDANPTVMIRLLDTPRLTPSHVAQILRNPAMPPRVLLAVRNDRRRMAHEETLWWFCRHPRAPVSDVLQELDGLSKKRLLDLARHPDTREAIRASAKRIAAGRVGR